MRTIEQPIWRGDEVVKLPVVEINSGCTGTIVSQRHILTAAHCVSQQNTSSQLYVRWRLADGTYNGDWFNAYYYPHPNYTGTGDNHDDVALISVHYSVNPSPISGTAYSWGRRLGWPSRDPK